MRAHLTSNVRDVEPDDDIRTRAAKLVREQGPNGAAKDLGVGRETVLSLAAGARVNRGTLALIRERLRRGNAAAPTAAPPDGQLRRDIAGSGGDAA